MICVLLFYTNSYIFLGDIMKYLKNIVFSLGIMLSTLFVFTFIITIFSYFNLMSNTLTTIFQMIIPIISVTISGIIMGIHSTKKGWLEGIKLGLLICLLLFFFNYFGLNNSFKINQLLFYGILIFTAVVGSMIGINIKNIGE